MRRARKAELLPEEMRLALFRIFQECLTNIAKHARATQVTIRLEKTEEAAVLEIQDNGVGFEVPQDWLELARQGHLGLVGMRERAEAVGGRLAISFPTRTGDLDPGARSHPIRTGHSPIIGYTKSYLCVISLRLG